MTKICQKAWVTGKVQGVFYRASTQKQANLMQITGYAKNLGDGRVEVLACGELEQIAKLFDWLSKGPAQAKVEKVDVEPCDFQYLDGFEVL